VKYTDWLRRQREAQERAPLSRLELVWRTEQSGIGPCVFQDFQIDGQSLFTQLAVEGQVGALGYFSEDYAESLRRMLLGTEASAWGGERVPLFLCHCGDRYCGAVTVEREFCEGQVFWKNVCRWECGFAVPTWEDFVPRLVFRFERKQYERALLARGGPG
jgi:hypothetical protein